MIRLIDKTLGGTLIVAGTTVGAGMLGFPLVAHTLGYAPSIALMVTFWVLMTYTAWVTARLNLPYKEGISVAGLSHYFLGKWPQRLAAISLFLLLYSLLGAYISGGSSLTKVLMEQYMEQKLGNLESAALFTGVIGLMVTLSIPLADYANRLLFIIKIVAFGMLVLWLMPEISLENITQSRSLTYKEWFIAIPILFTAFGFHGSIPSIVNYIGSHPRKLAFAMVVGSAIPLIVYLLWQTCTIGALPSNILETYLSPARGGANVGNLVAALNHVTSGHELKTVVNVFTALAIATSFLGVSLGLVDLVTETFRFERKFSSRITAGLITFLPPLGFAMVYPQGFFFALGFASIPLSILAVILPSLCAIEDYNCDDQMVGFNKWLIHRLPLTIAFYGGLFVIGVELYNLLNK